MAIFWNDQVDIQVEAATDHFIHLLCHLGVPSEWGATKKDMFAWILSKVNMKLESWKGNLPQLARSAKLNQKQ